MRGAGVSSASFCEDGCLRRRPKGGKYLFKVAFCPYPLKLKTAERRFSAFLGLFPPFYPRKRRSPYLYTARASFSRILHPNPSRPATRCDDGLTVIFADSALAYDCPGTAAKCNLNAFFTDSASESIPPDSKVR